MITVSFLYKGKEVEKTFWDVRKAARFIWALRAKGLRYMGAGSDDPEEAYELVRLAH